MLCSEKEYDIGMRDKGRAGMTLDDFWKHGVSEEAKLKLAEVLALRLYSMKSFQVMTPNSRILIEYIRE